MLAPEIREQIPLTPIINHANVAREHGDWEHAIAPVATIENLSPDQLHQLHTDPDADIAQKEFLAAARIDVGAHMTQTRRSQLNPFEKLAHTLRIHQQLYQNQEVQEMAQQQHQNAEGGAYEFYLEMQRDSARLYLLAARATGNNLFLQAGIRVLDEAITYARNQQDILTDSTIMPLMQFEQARLAHRMHNMDTQEFYEIYHHAYNAALGLDPEGNTIPGAGINLERAATLAAWMRVDALQTNNTNIAEQAVREFINVIEQSRELNPENKYEHIMDTQMQLARRERIQQMLWTGARIVHRRQITDINQFAPTV